MRQNKPMPPESDVTIEKGGGFNPERDPESEFPRIFWVTAQNKKGEAFLTAYFEETDKPLYNSDDDNDVIEGSFLLEELEHFKRMATAAGVKLNVTIEGPRTNEQIEKPS